MSLKLTALDQSPVIVSESGASAPVLTASLAKACDEWGYHRFWVAEHHNAATYAGPCPEILVGHIASQTKNIRVGSGGVMLSHYSPYKVAEQFRMLSTLYPNRIDLGIGRAPGGDGLASSALAFPYKPINEDTFPVQAELLKGFVDRSFPSNHPYYDLKVMPDDTPKPDTWMLGSGGGSATMAGTLGYKFGLGLFIGPQERSSTIIDDYEKAWREAGHEGDPEVMIVSAVFCADSKEEAKRVASTQALWKVGAFLHGRLDPFSSPDEVDEKYKNLSVSDQEYFDITRESGIYGTPDECLEGLHNLAKKFRATEMGIVTVTYEHEARMKSYKMVAEHNV